MTDEIYGSDDLDLAENPERRCPAVLLLDVSSSMAGQPIEELNRGLRIFTQSVNDDEIARNRVEVALVPFSTDVEVHDFVIASDFRPPTLEADGVTNMGAAILRGLELLEDRKQRYKQHNIPYYRPWVFLITDGLPTDDIQLAVQRVHEGVQNSKFIFFAIGVEGADMNVLRLISPQRTAKLKGLKFRELFEWLSNSLGEISRSRPGDKLKLPRPDSWMDEIEV